MAFGPSSCECKVNAAVKCRPSDKAVFNFNGLSQVPSANQESIIYDFSSLWCYVTRLGVEARPAACNTSILPPSHGCGVSAISLSFLIFHSTNILTRLILLLTETVVNYELCPVN